MAKDFKIKRVDDKCLVRVFQNAKEAGNAVLKSSSKEGNLSGNNHQISVMYSSDLPWKITEEDLNNISIGQFLIASVTLTFSVNSRNNQQNVSENVTFAFTRGGADSLLDNLRVTTSNKSGAIVGKGEQKAQKAIHKAISQLLAPVAPEDGGLVPTLSNLAEAFNVTYQKISMELSDAVAAVSRERAAQITEFQQERKRLQDEIAAERQRMHDQANQEIEAAKSELTESQAKLDAEWNKLEVSTYKDARRRQFIRLQEDLQAALQSPVTDLGLRTTRWAVFIALLIAGGAAGFFAHDSITAGAASTSAASTGTWIFTAIRSFVLTVASFSAFIGAAAWLRYFYVRDLTAQEELMRFRNDMARASWVMDAALEIRKEHNEDIPPEWIVGVTQGLFAAKKKDTLEEGAHALAALMGLSASATFGPGGATVELSKKGGKAVSEAAKKLQNE